jgi:hypothetical protein
MEMLQIDAPDWYINPAYRLVFSERSAYDSIAACSPIIFPPNLHDVLTSSQPPGIDFFKSLPKPTGKMWGVYGLTLEKAGCNSKLYIGSGTNTEQGVSGRLAHYEPGGSGLLGTTCVKHSIRATTLHTPACSVGRRPYHQQVSFLVSGAAF